MRVLSMTRMDVSEGPIVPATRTGFGSRASNPPVTQMPSGASQSATRSSRSQNVGPNGANAGDAKVWDNDDDSSNQTNASGATPSGASGTGLDRSGFRGTQGTGTQSDDSGTNFQSILNELSGSQADDDSSQDGPSGSQGAKNQSGSDSGSTDSGKASSRRTADVATTPVDIAGAAKQILPFTLTLSGIREAIPSDGDSPATWTAALSRAAASASGIRKDGSGHDSNDAVREVGHDSIHESLRDAGHEFSDPPPSRMGLDAQDDLTTQVSADASNAHAGELAFAAKLIPNSEDPAAPPTEAQANAAAAQKSAIAGSASNASLTSASSNTISSSTLNTTLNPTAANTGGTAGDQNGAGAEGFLRQAALYSQESGAGHAGSASRTESATPATSAGSPAAARLGESIELKPTAPASPSDITVRIPDSGRGTDVRFVERAGEVHVSVKTSDPGMAQTLRGGLNDFAARLDQTGIRAELWRPGSESSDSSSSQNGSDDRPSDRHSGRQTGSDKDQAAAGDPEEGQQNSKKPKWVEALEMSIGRQ